LDGKLWYKNQDESSNTGTRKIIDCVRMCERFSTAVTFRRNILGAVLIQPEEASITVVGEMIATNHSPPAPYPVQGAHFHHGVNAVSNP